MSVLTITSPMTKKKYNKLLSIRRIKPEDSCVIECSVHYGGYGQCISYRLAVIGDINTKLPSPRRKDVLRINKELREICNELLLPVPPTKSEELEAKLVNKGW